MSTSNRVNLSPPQELITEILSNLPAKSLGRCKCVSKPWRALISDPQFIKTHLTKTAHLHQKLILISNDSDSGDLYSVEFNNRTANCDGSARKLNFDHPDNWSEIWGSCDGLILVEDDETRTIFLLNPTTLESKEIPVSPFALPPRTYHIMYGFGYDLSTDDYKVVTISHYDTDNEHEPDCTDMFVNVYMLKRNVWRRVQNSPYDHAVAGPHSGVFVNGRLHWLTSKVSDYSSVIGAFDLASEDFTEVPPPSEVDNDKLVFHDLAVLAGCLCLVIDCRNRIHTDVWVMKEYGAKESWTKFLIVHRDLSIRPLRFLGENEVLLEIDGEKLVVYNVEDETLKDMAVLEIPSEFQTGLSFMDSLVSPNCGNEISGDLSGI